MTPEEIKVGETYNVRVKVHAYSKGIIFCSTVISDDGKGDVQCGEEYDICHDEIAAITPAPKYDPCRLFKKGDIVRVVERMGRTQPNIPLDEFFQAELLTVSDGENFSNNLVKIKSKDGREKLSHWWYLELVTPVEELEPYFVSEGDLINEWEVCKRVGEKTNCTVSTFTEFHPHAKEAAEAECARLNAEYREEVEK